MKTSANRAFLRGRGSFLGEHQWDPSCLVGGAHAAPRALLLVCAGPAGSVGRGSDAQPSLRPAGQSAF